MHGANFAFNHVSSPQGVTAYGALGAGAPPGAAAARNDSGADAAGAYQGGGLKRAATAAYAASPPKPPATKSRTQAAPVTIITRKDQYRAFPYVPEGTRVKFLRGRECVEGLLFASFDVAVTARAVSDPDLHELGGGGPVCVYKGVPYHVQPGRDLKAIIVVGAAAAAATEMGRAGAAGAASTAGAPAARQSLFAAAAPAVRNDPLCEGGAAATAAAAAAQERDASGAGGNRGPTATPAPAGGTAGGAALPATGAGAGGSSRAGAAAASGDALGGAASAAGPSTAQAEGVPATGLPDGQAEALALGYAELIRLANLACADFELRFGLKHGKKEWDSDTITPDARAAGEGVLKALRLRTTPAKVLFEGDKARLKSGKLADQLEIAAVFEIKARKAGML